MESPSSEQLLADRIVAAPDDQAARLALVELALARGQAEYARRLLADVKDRPELRALHDKLRAQVETNARPLAPRPRGCAVSALAVLALLALVLVGAGAASAFLDELPDLERRHELARERARLGTLHGMERVRSAERVLALATDEDVEDEVMKALDPLALEGGAACRALALIDAKGSDKEPLVAALAHPDRSVRLVAAKLIRAPRTEAEARKAVEAAEGDRELARILLRPLVASRREEAFAFVERVIRGEDRSFRLDALRAIAKHCESSQSDRRYEAILDAALTSKDAEARGIAMEASLYHGIPEAGAALLEKVRQRGLIGSRELEPLARKLSHQGADRLEKLLDEETDPNAQTVLRLALQINARERGTLTPKSSR